VCVYGVECQENVVLLHSEKTQVCNGICMPGL
jgi:hypothetical protein